MSFFGGDHSVAHWSVHIRKKHGGFRSSVEQKSERLRVREAEAILKEHGYKETTRFEFKVADEKQKASQRIAADKLAKVIFNDTGVQMDVVEGCFL